MRTVHDLNDKAAISSDVQEDGGFRDDIEWTLAEAANYFGCSYDTLRREVNLLLKHKADGFTQDRRPEQRLGKTQMESIRRLRQLRANRYRGQELIRKLIG